jgi:5-methylcytosine-specific restriction endonuclease McrA
MIQCHCGNKKEMLIESLLKGFTRSCGCQTRRTRALDLTNRRFGKLICLEKIGVENTSCLWKCKCDCGKFCERRANYLNGNKNLHCGCETFKNRSKSAIKNIQGIKFNRLLPIKIVGRNKSNQTLWECLCDCGNITVVEGTSVNIGRVKSCGCLQREVCKNKRGSDRYNYNPNITDEERKQRRDDRVVIWSKQVLTRDNWTCQRCGQKGNINAHHILPYHKYRDLRFDINNGICLCVTCHKQFHKKYGFDVNKEQLDIFIEEFKENNDIIK